MDYSTLKQQILSDIRNDTSLKTSLNVLQNKIKNGTAKYSDAVELSKRLGKVTSKYLTAHTVEPTQELLGQYADEILAPIYESMQSTSLAATKEVQRIYNKKAQFGLNPADVPTDESRIKHIVRRFKEAESFDTVSFLIGEDVAENIARGAVTDSLRANAKQFDDAGIETYVSRNGVGCCDWCASMTGTYSLDNIPSDFWRVHKACTCTFDYKVNNKRTRITYSTGDDGKMTKNTTEY